jgi:hypothetical protein
MLIARTPCSSRMAKRTSIRFVLQMGDGCITRTRPETTSCEFPLRRQAGDSSGNNGLRRGYCCALGGLSPDGKQMPFFSLSSFARKEVQIVNLDAGPNPTRHTLSPDSRVAGPSCSRLMDAQWPIRSWKWDLEYMGATARWLTRAPDHKLQIRDISDLQLVAGRKIAGCDSRCVAIGCGVTARSKPGASQ